MTNPTNKEELVARLEATKPQTDGRTVFGHYHPNPDGPEAAKVIRDLEAENARLRSAPIPAVQSGAVAWPAADPRYEIDVTYEVWQGDCLVAGSTDLNDARRYEALYQPCSLLKATTYRQPAHLPDAAPQSEPLPGGVGEAVTIIRDLLADESEGDPVQRARDFLAALSWKEQTHDPD